MKRKIQKLIGIILYLLIMLPQLHSQVPEPIVWMRADSCSQNRSEWRNLIDDSRNNGTFLNFNKNGRGGNDSEAETINYNPSFYVKDDMQIVVDSITTETKNVTVMIVYQVFDSLQEQNVWQITTSKDRAGQSTQQIYDKYGANRLRKNNFKYAVVSTQTQKIERSEDEQYTLQLGEFDTLPFDGKISEVLVFSDIDHNSITRLWEPYLAIKHGVTLYDRKYYNSNYEVTWNNTDSSFQQIIGIGKDEYFGLNQKQSISPDGKIVFGVSEKAERNAENRSQIEDLEFILLGIDTLEFKEKSEIALENGFSLTTFGKFRIENNRIQSIPTFLEIDCSHFIANDEDFAELENYNLFIDRSGEGNFRSDDIEIYPVTQIDREKKTLIFKNIYWDSDHNGSDVFCLASLTPDSIINMLIIKENNPEDIYYSYFDNVNGGNISQRKSQENTDNGNGDVINCIFTSCVVYPNPNSGYFTVDLQLAEQSEVVISIIDASGKFLESRKLKGQSVYNEMFMIDAKGEYLVKIQTGKEVKISKVVVY